jgi:hypothetical protein
MDTERHKMTTPKGTFHNAITGETITRELTADEIIELTAPLKEPDETPYSD